MFFCGVLGVRDILAVAEGVQRVYGLGEYFEAAGRDGHLQENERPKAVHCKQFVKIVSLVSS